MLQEDFTETSTAIAARAACQPYLVRKYASQGWVPYRAASNGTWLFQPSAATTVRDLKAKGLARRGHPTRRVG